MIAFLLAASLWVAGPLPIEDQSVGAYCAQTFHEQVRVAVSYAGYADCVTANPVGGQDALLRRYNGAWHVLVRGGGWIDVMSMTYHGVPQNVATQLYARKQSAYREKFGSK